jgi:L-ascorbate metabolism protein UlaG (beta-lactamase superfamily)
MTDGTVNLYTDFPYKSGAYGYMKYNAAEIDSVQSNAILLFTHRHADHYSRKIIKKLKKEKAVKKYGSGNIGRLKKLNSLSSFRIEKIKTKHRFSLKHYSYIITWHGKRIFLSGDTESAATVAGMKELDWAFVPSWIMLDAQEKKLTVPAKTIGIYHLYPNQKFKKELPKKIELLDKQGEVIVIPY